MQISDTVIIISAGSESTTIQTTLSNSCPLVWEVSGGNATLEAGQSCTVSVNGVNAAVAWTTSSAALAGSTITGTAGGSANNGCSFTQQFTLTKL